MSLISSAGRERVALVLLSVAALAGGNKLRIGRNAVRDHPGVDRHLDDRSR